MFELTEPSLKKFNSPVRPVQRAHLARRADRRHPARRRRVLRPQRGVPPVPDQRPEPDGARPHGRHRHLRRTRTGLLGLVDSLGLGRPAPATPQGPDPARVRQHRAALRAGRTPGPPGRRRADDRPAAHARQAGPPGAVRQAILALQLIAALTFLGYTAAKKDVRMPLVSDEPVRDRRRAARRQGPPAGEGAGGRRGRRARGAGRPRSGSSAAGRASRCGSTTSSRARSSRTPRRPSAPPARCRR